MGFSISGSAAIVFAGMFIAFGIFYGATSNSFERVSDAQSGQSDEIIDQKNIDIEIVAYERIDSTDTAGPDDRLTVLVNNTGSKELAVDETELILDNEYLVPETTNVTVGQTDAGETRYSESTNLWAPGEQLNITARADGLNEADRVRIVSEHGVADTVIISGESKVVF